MWNECAILIYHSLMSDQPINKMNHAELAGLYKGKLESLNYNLAVFELLNEDEHKMKAFQIIIANLINDQKPTNEEQ